MRLALLVNGYSHLSLFSLVELQSLISAGESGSGSFSPAFSLLSSLFSCAQRSVLNIPRPQDSQLTHCRLAGKHLKRLTGYLLSIMNDFRILTLKRRTLATKNVWLKQWRRFKIAESKWMYWCLCYSMGWEVISNPIIILLDLFPSLNSIIKSRRLFSCC